MSGVTQPFHHVKVVFPGRIHVVSARAQGSLRFVSRFEAMRRPASGADHHHAPRRTVGQRRTHLVALLSRQGRELSAQRSLLFGEVEACVIADGSLGDGHHRPVGVGEQRRHLHQLAFVEVFVVGLRVESFVRGGVRREVHRQRLGIARQVEGRQLVVHHVGVPALLLGEDVAEGRAVVERPHDEIDPAVGRSLFRQRDHRFGVGLLDVRGLARDKVVTLHAAAAFDASGAESAAEFAAVEDEAHAASVDKLRFAVEYVVFRQRFPVHADRHANLPVGRFYAYGFLCVTRAAQKQRCGYCENSFHHRMS